MMSCASRLAALSLLLGLAALAQQPQIQLTKICDATASPPQCASVAADGTLKTSAGGGGGGGDNASSATGAAVPADANYTGFNSGGNLVGVSAANPLPVASLQSGTWSVKLLDSGGTNQLSIDASGRLTVLQGGGAWSVTQSGTWTVQQGTPPWSVSQSGSWTVTDNQGSPNTLANAWPQKLTDGTNGPVAVKAASTAAAAADPALVVGLSPNSPLPAGSNALGSVSVSNFPGTQPVSGTVTANQGTPNTAANSWPVEVTDGTNVLGTAAHPVRVDPTGTTTQPISASSLPLPTGAATAANQTAVQGTAGSPSTTVETIQGVSGGQPVPVSGTVTTSPPANASTNVTQFGGNPVVTGTGASGAGVPRVTVSSDSFPAVQATQDFDAGVSLAQLQAQLAAVQNQLAALSASTKLPKGLDGRVATDVDHISQAIPVQPHAVTLDGGTASVTGTVTANAGMGPFIVGGPVSSGTAPSPTLDTGFPVNATLNRVNTRTLTSAAFSTGGAGRVLVVAVTFAAAGTTVYPVTISDAAGLTWTKQVENIESPNAAGAAVWTAYSASTLINDTITATNSATVLLSGEFSIYSFANASQTVGAKGGRSWVSGAALPVDSTALSVQAGSWVIAAFVDGNTGVGLPGTTLSTTTFDVTSQDVGNGNSFGTAHSTVASTTSGTLTIGTNGSDTFLQTAAIELQAQAYPALVAGVYNVPQPSLSPGQVAQAQSAQRGGLVVATGLDPFLPSQASNSLPWSGVTNVVLQPLNPLLQRCNAVRRSNCQP